MAPVLEIGQVYSAFGIHMLSNWDFHVCSWLQEANGWSKRVRIQNPEANGYVVRITYLRHRNNHDTHVCMYNAARWYFRNRQLDTVVRAYNSSTGCGGSRKTEFELSLDNIKTLSQNKKGADMEFTSRVLPSVHEALRSVPSTEIKGRKGRQA